MDRKKGTRIRGFLLKFVRIAATMHVIIFFWFGAELYFPAVADFFACPAFGQEKFEDYVIGGSGKWQCIPKYVPPQCPGREERLTELEEAVRSVFSECQKMAGDKPTLNKYALGISALMIWNPLITATVPVVVPLAAAIWSDIKYDLGECVIRGFNKLGFEHPEKKEAFDDFVKKLNIIRDTTSDVWESADGGYEYIKRRLGERVKPQEPWLVRAWQSYELGWHAGEIKEILEIYEPIKTLLRVPSVDAAKHLEKADKLVSDCEFHSARKEFDEAEKDMRKFCEWEGYYYRNLEKWLECYYEWHARAIHWGDTPQAHKFHEGRRQLDIQRNYITNNLDLFVKIDNLRTESEKREPILNEYYKTAKMMNGAVREGDLVKACDYLCKIQSIREKIPEKYIHCIEPEPEVGRGGFISLPNNDHAFDFNVLYAARVQEVKKLLERAEKAINDCKFDYDSVYGDLWAAKQKVSKLVMPSNGKCVPTQEAAKLNEKCNLLEKRMAAECKPSWAIGALRPHPDAIGRPTCDIVKLRTYYQYGNKRIGSAPDGLIIPNQDETGYLRKEYAFSKQLSGWSPDERGVDNALEAMAAGSKPGIYPGEMGGYWACYIPFGKEICWLESDACLPSEKRGSSASKSKGPRSKELGPASKMQDATESSGPATVLEPATGLEPATEGSSAASKLQGAVEPLQPAVSPQMKAAWERAVEPPTPAPSPKPSREAWAKAVDTGDPSNVKRKDSPPPPVKKAPDTKSSPPPPVTKKEPDQKSAPMPPKANPDTDSILGTHWDAADDRKQAKASPPPAKSSRPPRTDEEVRQALESMGFNIVEKANFGAFPGYWIEIADPVKAAQFGFKEHKRAVAGKGITGILGCWTEQKPDQRIIWIDWRDVEIKDDSKLPPYVKLYKK